MWAETTAPINDPYVTTGYVAIDVSHMLHRDDPLLTTADPLTDAIAATVAVSHNRSRCNGSDSRPQQPVVPTVRDDVTGCWVTKPYSEVAAAVSADSPSDADNGNGKQRVAVSADTANDADNSNDEQKFKTTTESKNTTVWDLFQAECATPEFESQFEAAGFTNARFHPNPYYLGGRVNSNPVYQRFVKALQDIPSNTTDGACCSLGIVFHGTSSENISTILKNGLDPLRRKGQALGPGEYFGKHPSTSIGYCRRGLEMMVFLVVLPSTLTNTATNRKTSSTTDTTNPNNNPKQVSRQRMGRMRHGAVVVENNAHQLPIGTMKFGTVEQQVLRESNLRRQQLSQLEQELALASQTAQETQTKARIIQDLIAGQCDVASERYQKHCGILRNTSKKEIKWYIPTTMDADIIDFYFPGLSPKISDDKINQGKRKKCDQTNIHNTNESIRIPSVEEVVAAEAKAKERLQSAKDMAKEKDDEDQRRRALGMKLGHLDVFPPAPANNGQLQRGQPGSTSKLEQLKALEGRREATTKQF